MASLFTSWLQGTKPNSMGEEDDLLTPMAESDKGDLQPMASPVDRSDSKTPKAPFQFQHQSSGAVFGEHARDASDATLDGRQARRYASHTSSLGPHLQQLTDNAIQAHQRHNRSERAYTHDSIGSPRSSLAHGSELNHGPPTQFSSTLGGVDSEAAWSEPGHGGPKSSFSHRDSSRRRKRKIAPPEVLVIVKPPPSAKNNLLKLQIQLVMPQQIQRREGSSRTSGESLRPTDVSSTKAPNLQRRNSTSSSRSAASEISTAASTTSNSSGRRVTPLYNFNFHQILSTTVTDAGTDQRIAKYTRKGVELDGFGLLEPTELINGVNDLSTLYRAGMPGSPAAMSENRGTSMGSDSRPNSHEMTSVVSAPAGGPGTLLPDSVEPPTSYQAMTAEAKGQESNLGGKLMNKFKRLSIGIKPISGPVPNSGSSGMQASSSSVFGKFASKVGGAESTIGFVDPTVGSVEIPQMSPGAGIQEGKRTEGYYWTVKKWNRRAQDGMSNRVHTDLLPDGSNPVLNNVWKRFNLVNRLGGKERHPPPREIPLRLEWSRNSKRAHLRRATEDTRAKVRASTSLNASRSDVDNAGPTASTSSLNVTDGPRSTGSSRPSSFLDGKSPRPSMDTNSASNEVSGSESDPEDSETPWSCHLVLGPSTRIPLGTLSPAPHHPKLVGQLAVPFPLPDLSATGLGYDGMGLAREELKDIIMVTCLHLIVRESFGGLPKRRAGMASNGSGMLDTSASSNGWRLSNVPPSKR